VHTADNLTAFMCRLSLNLGASTSWNPQGLSRPVMGLLYLYLYLYHGSIKVTVFWDMTLCSTMAVSLTVDQTTRLHISTYSNPCQHKFPVSLYQQSMYRNLRSKHPNNTTWTVQTQAHSHQISKHLPFSTFWKPLTLQMTVIWQSVFTKGC